MQIMLLRRVVCYISLLYHILNSEVAMMHGLTLTLKNEIVQIAPRGRVNCVAPGWVKTPLAEEALRDPNVVYRALATSVTFNLSFLPFP